MARPLTREIRVPFTIGPHGGVDFTVDPIAQAIQHITAAVATNPGERVMRPEYGAPVWDALFGSDDPAEAAALAAEMRRSLNTWEPEIDVVRIELVDVQPDDGLMQYFISFRLLGSGETHEANIFVGGTVAERTLPR